MSDAATAPRRPSRQLSNLELRDRARGAAARLTREGFDGVLESDHCQFLAELLITLASRIPPKGAGKGRRR